MTREVLKAICKVCTDEHPRTLFAKNGVCVFCAQKQQMKAEEHAEQNIKISESERRKAEQLDARSQLRAEMERLKEAKAREELRQKAEAAQFDPARAAEQELARRVLAKQHLLPFVQRTMPDYKAGWVHKDICEHLEWFSEAVSAGESPRLAIFMPPRHGKSQLASIDFPAWHLGKNPHHEFISCSYSGALAMKFSRKVRALVRERGYQQVFPEFELDPDSQSAEEWLTTKGGGYRAAGVGGPITGTGAHCFPAGTLVRTASGQEVPIEQLKPGMSVCTSNLKDDIIRTANIEAIVAHDCEDRLIEVRTASGRVVRATPNHRFFVPGMGWVEARDLRPGYPVQTVGHPDTVQQLSQTDNSPDGRGGEIAAQRAFDRVLLNRVSGSDTETAERQTMQPLRRAVPQWQEPECEVLLDSLPEGCSPDADSQTLSAVRQGLSTEVETHDVLQPGLREQGPCRSDDRGGELSVSGRAQLRRVVSADAAFGIGAGSALLRGLPETGAGQSNDLARANADVLQLGDTPHRPQPAEQFAGEPDHALLRVSHDPSQIGNDTVSSVTEIGDRGVRVYDIQVAGTHCFFANQILVHNCLVIDDPVKNREEAESETTRESVWDWYTSTAYTRLAPGGGVLLILTRWHDDDLAGRLMTAMANDEGDEWRVVNYPAIAEYDELYRKAGEPLHPDRYPLEALKRIKRAVGQRDWSALYQQNPVPNEGAFFTKSLFKWYLHKDMPPWDEMIFYTAWDLAVGQKQVNDFSVGVTVGVDKQDNIYVVDVQRGRWDSLTLVETMLDTYETWKPALIGIERGQIELSIGPLLLKRARERRLAGFGYEPLKPGKNDKVARAQSIKGRMQQGRVFFRTHCDVTQALVNEMLRFPAGVHDDCVDSIAYIGKMLDMFAVPRTPSTKPKKSWKDKLPLSARSGKLGWQAA